MLKNSNILYYFILLSAILPYTLQFSSTQNINRTGEKIELLNADSLIGTTGTVSALVRSYEGNVSFRHGDIRVFCSKAFHDISGNRLELQNRVMVTQQDMQLSSNSINYNGNNGIATSPSRVTITDKNAHLTANSGYYSTHTHVADFVGNVKISDDTVSIYSDSASYNRQTQFSNAFGNVLVEDDSSLIIADKIENNRRERITKAFGDVMVTGKYNSTYLTADTIENFARTNYITARSHPVLFKIDTLERDSIICDNDNFEADTLKFGKYDTLSISADLMESIKNSGNDHYIFTGKVEANRSDLQAKAERMIYDYKSGNITMYGNPIIWFDSTQIQADTITISMFDNKLKNVTAYSNAFVSIANDTINTERISQLSGNSIQIDFNDTTISVIHSFGDAKALLFMDSEKGSEGITNTSADTINIEFFEGEPDQFVALGGIVGEAVPDNIVSQNTKMYYLPDFKRNYKKPEKKVLPFKNNIISRKH